MSLISKIAGGIEHLGLGLMHDISSLFTPPAGTTGDDLPAGFFAWEELEALREGMLAHAEASAAQILDSRIAYQSAPFEPWIPGNTLDPIKESFRNALLEPCTENYKDRLLGYLNPGSPICREVFSIQSCEERQIHIAAFRRNIHQLTGEEFARGCDDVLEQMVPQLVDAAKKVLENMRAQQELRDLERERLLLTRAKLTAIDDYLNTSP